MVQHWALRMIYGPTNKTWNPLKSTHVLVSEVGTKGMMELALESEQDAREWVAGPLDLEG